MSLSVVDHKSVALSTKAYQSPDMGVAYEIVDKLNARGLCTKEQITNLLMEGGAQADQAGRLAKDIVKRRFFEEREGQFFLTEGAQVVTERLEALTREEQMLAQPPKTEGHNGTKVQVEAFIEETAAPKRPPKQRKPTRVHPPASLASNKRLPEPFVQFLGEQGIATNDDLHRFFLDAAGKKSDAERHARKIKWGMFYKTRTSIISEPLRLLVQAFPGIEDTVGPPDQPPFYVERPKRDRQYRQEEQQPAPPDDQQTESDQDRAPEPEEQAPAPPPPSSSPSPDDQRVESEPSSRAPEPEDQVQSAPNTGTLSSFILQGRFYKPGARGMYSATVALKCLITAYPGIENIIPKPERKESGKEVVKKQTEGKSLGEYGLPPEFVSFLEAKGIRTRKELVLFFLDLDRSGSRATERVASILQGRFYKPGARGMYSARVALKCLITAYPGIENTIPKPEGKESGKEVVKKQTEGKSLGEYSLPPEFVSFLAGKGIRTRNQLVLFYVGQGLSYRLAQASVMCIIKGKFFNFSAYGTFSSALALRRLMTVYPGIEETIPKPTTKKEEKETHSLQNYSLPQVLLDVLAEKGIHTSEDLCSFYRRLGVSKILVNVQATRLLRNKSYFYKGLERQLTKPLLLLVQAFPDIEERLIKGLPFEPSPLSKGIRERNEAKELTLYPKMPQGLVAFLYERGIRTDHDLHGFICCQPKTKNKDYQSYVALLNGKLSKRQNGEQIASRGLAVLLDRLGVKEIDGFPYRVVPESFQKPPKVDKPPSPVPSPAVVVERREPVNLLGENKEVAAYKTLPKEWVERFKGAGLTTRYGLITLLYPLVGGLVEAACQADHLLNQKARRKRKVSGDLAKAQQIFIEALENKKKREKKEESIARQKVEKRRKDAELAAELASRAEETRRERLKATKVRPMNLIDCVDNIAGEQEKGGEEELLMLDSQMLEALQQKGTKYAVSRSWATFQAETATFPVFDMEDNARFGALLLEYKRQMIEVCLGNKTASTFLRDLYASRIGIGNIASKTFVLCGKRRGLFQKAKGDTKTADGELISAHLRDVIRVFDAHIQSFDAPPAGIAQESSKMLEERLLEEVSTFNPLEARWADLRDWIKQKTCDEEADVEERQKLLRLSSSLIRIQIEKEKLFQTLFRGNIKQASSILSREYKYAESREDLLPEATMGLDKAIRRWDPTTGALTTLAWRWMRQMVNRYLQDHSRTVCVPVYVQDQWSIIRRCEKEFLAEHGRFASPQELAGLAALPIEAIDRYRQRKIENVGIHHPVDPYVDGSSFEELYLKAPSTQWSPEDRYKRKEAKDRLDKLLKGLSSKQADVIRKHLLEGMTLEEIGKGYNVSRERIRQIEVQGLLRLHKKADQIKKNELSKITLG